MNGTPNKMGVYIHTHTEKQLFHKAKLIDKKVSLFSPLSGYLHYQPHSNQ